MSYLIDFTKDTWADMKVKGKALAKLAQYYEDYTIASKLWLPQPNFDEYVPDDFATWLGVVGGKADTKTNDSKTAVDNLFN
jgi:hypothetical protein